MQFGQAQTHLYIDQCFEMVRSGKVVLDITHRVPLTNASEDGDALAAGISSPTNIAIDNQGNIFVCEGNSLIRWITPNGKVRTITPTISLSRPQGIAVDATGTLYVSDYFHNGICKIIVQ